MASNYTTNYELPLWEPQDSFLRAEFNEANQKIDAAIAAKADAAEVTALESEVDALAQSTGNCRIVTGSYTGTGEYGSAHPNTLTFDGPPLVLMVNGGWQFTALWGSMGTPSMGANNDVSHVTFSWEGNSVSWHSTGASQQLNEVNENYAYIALLSAVLS